MSYNANTSKYIEPPLRKGSDAQSRWRWWYSGIADIMIRDPSVTQTQIAAQLNKHPMTIALIVNTDMFREYFHQRREAYREDHDHALRVRMTEVATEGLDIVLEQLKTKRTQIPLHSALKVVESSLDRLGYSPNAPAVVVNNNVDARQQTVALTPHDLEAARAAMRLAEQSKTGSSLAPPMPPGPTVLEACGVGQDVLGVGASIEGDHDTSP